MSIVLQEILKKKPTAGQSVKSGEILNLYRTDSVMEAMKEAYELGFIDGRDKAIDWAVEQIHGEDNDELCMSQIQKGKIAKELQP